ncbi:MAG: toll/interleukin-1 receptor domain-containing protein, partial [Geminicoccaceae bacterium]
MPDIVAFFSYTHADNTNTSRLVEMLHEEIQMAVARKSAGQIKIFLDKENIKTGDDWENVLRDHLEKADVLIPILTPNYFSRDWCRIELGHFIDKDPDDDVARIFPILLIDTPKNMAMQRQQSDELYNAIDKKQYADWTDFETEKAGQFSKELRDAINDFATTIVNALDERLALNPDDLLADRIEELRHQNVGEAARKSKPLLIELIDRNHARDTFQKALFCIGCEADGNQGIFVSGPDNEEVDKCLESLKKHTYDDGDALVKIERIDVPWPDEGSPKAFRETYCRALARLLKLGMAATIDEIAQNLRARQCAMMVVSPIRYRDWKDQQFDSVQEWLAIWGQIFQTADDLVAVPVIYTLYGVHPPGWQNQDSAPTVKSDQFMPAKEIIKALETQLAGADRQRIRPSGVFGFFGKKGARDHAPFEVVNPLTPVERVDVRSWLQLYHPDYEEPHLERFEELFRGDASTNGLDMKGWLRRA